MAKRRKPASERKDAIVNLQITQAEKSRIQAYAEHDQRTVSAFMRIAAMERCAAMERSLPAAVAAEVNDRAKGLCQLELFGDE